jgi:YidC/Oxa1 family membrane protein insertase
MDRRVALAIVLMLGILFVPTLLFPPKPPAPSATRRADSLRAESLRVDSSRRDTLMARQPAPAAVPVAPAAALAQAKAPADTSAGERVSVSSPLYRYTFSTRGARLVAAEPLDYRSFAPGDTGRAQLIPRGTEFLAYGLVVGNDTLSLAGWEFTPSQQEVTVGADSAVVNWVAQRGPLTVRLQYVFTANEYLFHVRGTVLGLGAGGLVLVGLGPRLRVVDADSASDLRAYGVVTKASSTENVSFGKLEPGKRRELPGPFEWVALKSKYFMAAVLTVAEGEPRLGGAVAMGGPREGHYATRADVRASLAAPGGKFRFAVYVGPQEYSRLARIGHELEDINPYGWIFRPVIRPFSIWIVRILLWMHDVLSLAYGWVLILFGLAVRVLLWPLNQKAMRSSVAMQAIQPEVKALQDRLKNDPQKLQQEMFKLYKEHGVNPLGGCLPMLIPMPVLFALFFVFANTIEFRGVPFLWLPDLSRADPLFIIPIVMGLSMFAVSRIGQIGVPPNPQAKMMLYVMPVMFTVLFLRFSSGLNLYYAVSNIASIPQQWLIARERLRRVGKG